MSDQATAPVDATEAAPSPFGAFEPPADDQEFVFEDVASLPAWADPSWAGVDEQTLEPCLRVPGMQYPDAQPYHTNIVRKGDTVKWDSAAGKLVVTAAGAPGTGLAISELQPATTSIAAGEFTLAVVGTGFTGDAQIVFDGEALATAHGANETTLSCIVVPFGEARSVNVLVRQASGDSNELPFEFTA